MIVADATIVVDMLLGPGSEGGDRLADHLGARDLVCAPHLVDAEVGQTIRRLARAGVVTEAEAWAMIGDLAVMPLQRYDHTRLLPRAFDLRHNVSVYDALYLALAEALDRPLLTGDAALREVPGCDATVEVLATGEA